MSATFTYTQDQCGKVSQFPKVESAKEKHQTDLQVSNQAYIFRSFLYIRICTIYALYVMYLYLEVNKYIFYVNVRMSGHISSQAPTQLPCTQTIIALSTRQ